MFTNFKYLIKVTRDFCNNFLVGHSLYNLIIYRPHSFKEDKCLSHILTSKPARTLVHVKLFSGITFTLAFCFVFVFTVESVTHPAQCREHGWCARNVFFALARWPVWLERHPVHRKVAGSIPGQGTYLGFRFDPQLRGV